MRLRAWYVGCFEMCNYYSRVANTWLYMTSGRDAIHNL